MEGGMEFALFLYFIVIIGLGGFLLTMIYRFVKAFEKIANAYERKNSMT